MQDLNLKGHLQGEECYGVTHTVSQYFHLNWKDRMKMLKEIRQANTIKLKGAPMKKRKNLNLNQMLNCFVFIFVGRDVLCRHSFSFDLIPLEHGLFVWIYIM